MSGLAEAELFISSRDRIFKQEPVLLYLITLAIGMGSSSVFPALAEQYSKKEKGFHKAYPHL